MLESEEGGSSNCSGTVHSFSLSSLVSEKIICTVSLWCVSVPVRTKYIGGFGREEDVE